MVNWLKQNAISIIIGLVSSYYFYSLSLQERIPVLIEIPTFRTSIFKVDAIRASPIKVFNNEKLVKNDINSMRIFLFNKGELSIRQENVLRPLIAQLVSEDVNIMDVHVFSNSRLDITKAYATVIEPNKIEFTFDILEHNDGLKVDIIYEGDMNTEVTFGGVVEGFGSVKTLNNVTFSDTYKKYGVLALITIASIFVLITPTAATVYKAYLQNNRKKVISKSIELSLMIAAFTLIVYYSIFLEERSYFDRIDIDTLYEQVPEKIL